jgi:nicotinamide phosphoribosyltransferase
MGGGLLQHVNRDTQKYAFKCAAALRGDGWVDVSKDPATDSGKRSKRGHLALVHEGGHYATVRGPRKDDHLVPVFENGAVLKTYTMAEVRQNAMQDFT